MGEKLVLLYWQHRERWRGKVLSLGSAWVSWKLQGFLPAGPGTALALTSGKQSSVELWEGQASDWALGHLGNCKLPRTDPPKSVANQLLLQAEKPKPDTPHTPCFVVVLFFLAWFWGWVFFPHIAEIHLVLRRLLAEVHTLLRTHFLRSTQ